MARSLAFWKYEDGVYLDNQEVYEKLCGGESPDGLAELPKEKIQSRVAEVFQEWERIDDNSFDGGEKGSFTAEILPRGAIFECSFSTGYDVLNAIIDIMGEFGCPLYDPQISERFDGK